jgi:putative aminopeptidase FrvX
MPSRPPHQQYLDWLLEITQIPTAAGREQRVVAWIERWVSERPDLRLTRDDAGNLVIAPATPWGDGTEPVFITAHLDHPAFVVERTVSPGTIELSFRGGVMDAFFEGAPITVHTASGAVHGRLVGDAPSSSALGKHYLAEVEGDVNIGEVATWELPRAEIDAQGIVHTSACDDLAALAAAISAMEELRLRRARGEQTLDVRLLFTRAEEIGFIGAIGACKLGTMPRGSRVIALENSRSFPDSPIGGGPIVRVGDRLSIFTPWLTNACAKRAEELAGAPAQPTASQTAASAAGKMRWQRKLMAGGACEASVFCAYGYDATCLCLPLGNYHNMPHLTELQAGTYDTDRLGPPRCAREFISSADYAGLVDLLVGIGQSLPREDPVLARIEKLYADKKHVLE